MTRGREGKGKKVMMQQQHKNHAHTANTTPSDERRLLTGRKEEEGKYKAEHNCQKGAPTNTQRAHIYII